MTSKKKKRPVFRPERAEQLQNASLDDDQRALLLALAGVEAVQGSGTAADQATLEELAAQIEGYDTEELQAAIHHLVNAKAKAERKMDWSELKSRKGRSNPNDE